MVELDLHCLGSEFFVDVQISFETYGEDPSAMSGYVLIGGFILVLGWLPIDGGIMVVLLEADVVFDLLGDESIVASNSDRAVP